MTNEEIIAMANEAGFTTATAQYPYEVVPIASPEQLTRFAQLIRNATLEEADVDWKAACDGLMKKLAACKKELNILRIEQHRKVHEEMKK